MIFQCALPTNTVVGPTYFNFETIRAVGYYQVPDTFVQAEAQQILQNAVLRPDALLLTSLVLSIFFWRKFFRRCILEDMIQQTDQHYLPTNTIEVSAWRFVKDQVSQTSQPSLMLLEGRKLTVVRIVSQKALNNDWMSMKILIAYCYSRAAWPYKRLMIFSIDFFS